MATVYRAFDPHFQRDVAIKVLPLHFLHDPRFRARFEREARIVAGLQHPAIVPVYDFGEDNSQPYLVMSLMSGGSLEDRLRQGPMPLVETERIVGRLAPALDAAHQRGVIHRDLKPANILFDQWNEPYLTDFGIVKLTGGSGDDSASLTTIGGIIGTPAYMSPEQVQGEQIDGRSDIYSLGVILFQMLSGRLPFDANTPIGLAFKHVSEPIPSIQALGSVRLPGEFQIIVNHAMAKQPAERYPTAIALSRDLSRLVHGSGPQPTVMLPR
ncbi:MAG: serine/threonine protein kinase, partial [Candidatus Promineofilum sp.]|nr:serine/threonine protein kinase [Promineifilum sp.]